MIDFFKCFLKRPDAAALCKKRGELRGKGKVGIYALAGPRSG
jgi:hypothetical protein